MLTRHFLFSVTLCLSFIAALSAQERDHFSDTWVAVDALGRALPTFDETGPPKPDKTVGLFYFLWNGRHGERGPFDVTKILAQDPDAIQNPDSPLWGPMYAPHHWGESVFGYYVGEDESVLRKHAQMLGDAGVDVIIFDVTNQLTYPESYRPLCNVFSEMQAAGNPVPKIAFLTPFWDPNRVVHQLWNDLYSKNEYSNLWFRWEGKPLIMSDPDKIGERFPFPMDIPMQLSPPQTLGVRFTADKKFQRVEVCTPTWEIKDAATTLTLYRENVQGEKIASQRFANLRDNGWIALKSEQPWDVGTYYIEMSEPAGTVGWWSTRRKDLPFSPQGFVNGQPVEQIHAFRLVSDQEIVDTIRNFFTFRKPEPSYFTGPSGPDQWSWLEVHPQHPFYSSVEPDRVEQVSVGVAQNAVDGKLSMLSHPRSHGRSFYDGKIPLPEERDFTGKNFAEQWKRAFELDPKFIFITSWNEWIMGRFDKNAPFYDPGPVNFVDQFDHEHSRDTEPVIGGHEDAYYYQMIGMIRKFKGTRPVPVVVPKMIVIDGAFDDWNDVEPTFYDTVGDPVRRDERGWGAGTRYVNQTGRNDIVHTKVSYDKENVYFYVQTAEPIIGEEDDNWMMLFLDTDENVDTGWIGYDFLIRKSLGTPERNTTILRNVSNRYEWTDPVTIPYVLEGNALEWAIPRRFFGNPEKVFPMSFQFKWADNIQQTGDWSDFTINGDVAPNDRYNYRAKMEP